MTISLCRKTLATEQIVPDEEDDYWNWEEDSYWTSEEDAWQPDVFARPETGKYGPWSHVLGRTLADVENNKDRLCHGKLLIGTLGHATSPKWVKHQRIIHVSLLLRTVCIGP